MHAFQLDSDAPGAAQQEETIPQKLEASIANVAVGKFIRIEATAGDTLTGAFLAYKQKQICVEVSEIERCIHGTHVGKLWVQGRATVKGLLVGGIILGVALPIGIAAFAAAMDQSTKGSEMTGYIIGGVVIGFAGGALIGAGIGSQIPKWHRKY